MVWILPLISSKNIPNTNSISSPENIFLSAAGAGPLDNKSEPIQKNTIGIIYAVIPKIPNIILLIEFPKLPQIPKLHKNKKTVNAANTISIISIFTA